MDSHGLPVVKVSRRGANRLQDGHVWVYRSDILAADGAAPGALVGVLDDREKFLGTALYSTASQIGIRMIAKEAVKDQSAEAFYATAESAVPEAVLKHLSKSL